MRPFIHRLASRLGISGNVRNSCHGVEVQLHGTRTALEQFYHSLLQEPPPAATIDSFDWQWQERDPRQSPPAPGFSIDSSCIGGADQGQSTCPAPLPDLALCDNCRDEFNDPANRRYQYPFISCCDCGPRWSMITALPYDRSRTTMSRFPLCRQCQREYDDPDDRRFHAESIACPECGPELNYVAAQGSNSAAGLASNSPPPLEQAVAALRAGQIIAVQGIGGFHLMVRAADLSAVQRLRESKQRPHKPLAVMFSGVEQVAGWCELSDQERNWLTHPAAPIVLLKKLAGSDPRQIIAPANDHLGALLGYTALHLRLLDGVGEPLLATSANRSGEPIETHPQQAMTRLAGIADGWLFHDRSIVHAQEDSVIRVGGHDQLPPQILRLGRGLAPLRLSLPEGPPVDPIIALGGHLKCAPALATGSQLVVTSPIDDLSSQAAVERFTDSVFDLRRRFTGGVEACMLVTDLHPEYATTLWAGQQVTRCAGQPPPVLQQVQHHHAHVAAVMVEHGLQGSVCGLAWDGSGFGSDGDLWGGEALVCDLQHSRRRVTLRRFPLPGGEAALREPAQILWGLLQGQLVGGQISDAEMLQLTGLSSEKHQLLLQMVKRGVNCPWSTSVGRLFDGAAALLRLVDSCSFEGQAALALQQQAESAHNIGEQASVVAFVAEQVEMERSSASPAVGLQVIDWWPLLAGLISAVRQDEQSQLLALGFHHALADIALQMATICGQSRVVLAGGCFQNRLLLKLVNERLQRAGFESYYPQRLPANDGALAVGQLAVARVGMYGANTKQPLAQPAFLEQEF